MACNGHNNSFFQLLQLWIPVYLLVSTPKARRFQTTVGHVAGNRPTSSFGPTVDFLPLIDWVAHGAMKHATASWSTAYSKHKKHKNPNWMLLIVQLFSSHECLSPLWPLLEGPPRNINSGDHSSAVPNSSASKTKKWRCGVLSFRSSQ